MFQPNAVIAGRYQVVRLVGQGGMSNLYLAYDRKYSNATVVVKEMTASYSDPKEQKMAVDLFHREAKLLASLNHRHIPKVFDYFQFAGKYYLSMEYIDGDDLAVKLEAEKGPLPERQVLEWGEQIAQVLFYLHKHEPPIVFRDVKPSNIMISSKGVKLIDFGIARHFDQAKKGDTMRIGSPGYAPPEQYAAQTDPRSDIYALGVTLHHALTGRDPTATSTPFLVPPARDLNPALSEATAAMLARATQLDPSDRYQSALELKKDIKHILNLNKQSTRVVGAPPALPVETAGTTDAPTGAPSSSAPLPSTTSNQQNTAAAQANQQNPGTSTQQASQAAGGQVSGTLTPANPSTAGGSASLAPPANQQPAPKKKAKLSLGKFLLAACLFALGAGIAALIMMPETRRNSLWAEMKSYTQALVGELYAKDNPEDRLRDSLMSGSPEALLPLFQSSDFKKLSEEKQELFRLNLLAAGSNQGPLKVLHILVPEGRDAKEIWKVSAQVVRTVNSRGGLGRELLIVVPEQYQPGTLAKTISQLLAGPEETVSQSFLILDGENEALPQNGIPELLFLSQKPLNDRSSIVLLTSSGVTYEELFEVALDASAPPSVWAIPGPVPSQAMDSVSKIVLPFSEELLKELFHQAKEAGGRVIMLAENASPLSDTSAEGEVLLLSTTPSQLPDLATGLQGRATVLSSPFEQHGDSAPLHFRPPDSEQLKLEQARIFDAIVLAAIPKDRAFQGLTISRLKNGEYQPKSATHYTWSGSSWLPYLDESGKKE
jgi:serine/threonine protein kinase